MHRRDLELLRARLAGHLIVHANQVVAKLRKLRAVALVRTGRQPVLLGPAYPAHRVFVGPTTPRTAQSLGAVLVFVEEKSAFV
jgi:hypothetical protein